MKCPLSNYVMERESGEDEVLLNDCFKEECAWWDTAFDMCTCRSIARQLDGILADIHRIAESVERLADRPN